MKMKLLLFLLAMLLLLSGCETKTKESWSPIVIMKEAKNLENHYQLYTDGDSVFLKDVKKDSTITLRKCYETIKERLTLPTVSLDTALPDSDLTKQCEEITPFTYDATRETSAMYIQSLIESGWVVSAEYANYLYIDMYLTKDDAHTRIIVLEDRVKIFKNISGEVPDPLSYINERASKEK